MSERLTGVELRAIRERVEKATLGDERLYVEKHCEDDYDIVDHNGHIQFAAFDRGTADFISKARQDIPKLLAEIGRLNRLYSELNEIAHNIEIDRNETAAEYREYYEKSEAEIEWLREKLGEAESLLSDAQSLMGNVHCYDTDEYRAISGYFDGGDSE